MKKLLLLATFLCISTITFSQTFDFDGLSYEINASDPTTVTVTGRSTFDLIFELIIPDTVTNEANETFTVVAIASTSFFDERLRTVVVGRNVTFIGDFAIPFQLDPFVAPFIPNTLTFLGEIPPIFLNQYSFSASVSDDLSSVIVNVPCAGLTSYTTALSPFNFSGINFFNDEFKFRVNTGDPTTVTVTGISLTNTATAIVIPDNTGDCVGTTYTVTSIGFDALSFNQLTSVIIPNSVTSIAERAFNGNQLTSVTIPDSVTSIEDRAFGGNQLTSVTVGNSVSSIGASAFMFKLAINPGTGEHAVTFSGENPPTIQSDSFLNSFNQITRGDISVTVSCSALTTYIDDPLYTGFFGINPVAFTAPADLCMDEGLQTNLSGGLSEGGVYSGPGVTDDGNGMTYSFDPVAAGAGIHNITYTFTFTNGCSNTASDTIEVFAVATVSFTAPADVCLNADTQTGLSGGTPAVLIESTTVELNLDYEDVFGPGSGVTGGEIVFDSSGTMISTNLIFFGNANGNVAPLIDATASGNTITLDFQNGPIGTFVADGPIIGATGSLNFTSGSDLIIDGDDFTFISATGTATSETLGSAIYAGPGVTNEASGTLYSFDPAVAGAGTHTITYTFTNDNGCAASASDTIEVFGLPVITFIAPEDVCVNAGVQTGLGNATPSGGIYTGQGVTDDGNGMTYSFDPTIAGIGTRTITYEFSDANSCSDTASNTIEVFAIDDPSFSYDASVYTGDDADPTPTITGLAGGTFSADNGLVLNPTTGTIDVSTTTPGTYAVTYTTSGNCINNSSANITVNVGLLTEVDAAFCGATLVTFDQNFTCEVVPGATQYDFQFTNQTTSIVTFSSNTEASNSLAMANLFDFGATYDVKVRATVDGVTGPYGTLTCLLTAPSSCAVPVTLITPPEICIDAGIQVLSGGATAGGVYSGPGVTDDGNGMTYSFDPEIAGLGAHTITYSFTDAIGCTNTATNTIAVVLDTVVAAFTAPADVCVNAGIQTNLTGGTPEGEVTTTTFQVGGFIDAPSSSNYGITDGFILFDSGGAMLPPLLNNFRFENVPTGQEYPLVDASVSGSEILLDFGDAGFGNIIVNYTVLEGTPLSDPIVISDLQNILSGTFVIEGVSYFFNSNNTTFAQTSIVGAGSGVYSGPGVTHDPFTMTYDFDPAVAGVGTHTITYTYTAPNGCSDTATDTIEVFDVPTVTFTAPGDLLLDAGVQTGLSGGTPIGSLASTTIVFDNVVFERPNFPDGIINGTSVVDASGTLISTNVTFFHPSVSQIPRPLLDLSVTGSEISLDFGTSTNGTFIHTGTITAVGTVLGTTGVVNTSGGALSFNDFIFSLAPNTVFTTTSIGSGVYSGPGVTDNDNGMTYSFDPATAGVGTHTITYTYTEANGCSSSASDTVVVFIDTCQDIATYDAAGWGAVMPSINNEVIIDADYDTSLTGLGSFEACKVTVNAGATLTVAADDFMFVFGDITVNGTLLVEHTGSVVQVDDAATVSGTGSFSVLVDTPNLDVRDFMIMGSPMEAETRENVWASAWNVQNYTPANFNPVAAVTDAYNFADAELDDWNLYTTGPLAAGEGFLVRPQTSLDGAGGVFSYNYNTGFLTNGVVTRPLNFNTEQLDSPNMLSNPYASAIDADVFLGANPEIDALYFWEHILAPDPMFPGANSTGSNYSMSDVSFYNAMGGIGSASGSATPTNIISTAQGFGTFANAAGIATFTNSMRLTSGNTTLRAPEVNRNRLWLHITSDVYNIGGTTLVGFTDNATEGFDRKYDSQKMATHVSIFSHIDGNDTGYAVQGREAFASSAEIVMGFSSIIEEETSYTISLQDFDGLAWETNTPYLIDMLTGSITNLNEGSYSFTSNKGIFNNRFMLQFEDEEVLGTNEASMATISVVPNPTNGILKISTPNSMINNITLFDIQGRLIQYIHTVEANTHTLDISTLQSAVYFLNIETEHGTLVKRIIKE